MNLLVDIGNTRTKYIYHDKNKESLVKVIDNSCLTDRWISDNFKGVTKCLLSNVKHKALTEMFDVWSKRNKTRLIVVTSEQQKFGVTTNYDVPEALGVDRWLALIGANSLFPDENVLIIDSGTATTVDVLKSGGLHLGGWILPGISVMTDSIVNATSNVKAQYNKVTSLSFGSNTADAVNNASLAATLGLIEQAISLCDSSRIKLERIIITGGAAESIIDASLHGAIHVPNLVFEGLKKFSS